MKWPFFPPLPWQNPARHIVGAPCDCLLAMNLFMSSHESDGPVCRLGRFPVDLLAAL